VQGELGIPDNDGVSGVGAAAVTDDDICVLGQNVNHFSLALVTPL
jgi:hypothetical protein